MKVSFIPKPGKTSYDTPRAYRPITLSNFLLKGLERIIQWRLQETTLNQPLLNQHAFTRGRSTETALDDVMYYIQKHKIKDRYVMAASLDCTGAFDNVTFESARLALTRHGVSPGITSWYMHLLENRTVTSDLYGTPCTFNPTMGSPKGGSFHHSFGTS